MIPADNGQAPVIALLIQGQTEMRETLAAMQKDVTEIRISMANQQGQWKGAKSLAAGVSAVVGFVVSMVTFLVSTKFKVD